LKEKPSSHRILLLEGISQCAVDLLTKAGFTVDCVKQSLCGDELKEKLKGASAVGIRSKTQLASDILEACPRLLCVGCFCIGTNQVDLDAAAVRGVPVFNSPFQNSRSVAELIIANIINLARQIGDRSMEVHRGTWNKSAAGCYEIRGKKLGIVGYGHIGSQLSVLAEAMGMDVWYYDIATVMPLWNTKRMARLEDLLRSCQFVTLHVPETAETKNMIGEKEIKMMKKGSFLLNASRGTVVVIPALVEALKSRHLAGAYVDVYPEEPEANTLEFKQELQGCPNTILTPHIGGSTLEAQEAIGVEVAEKFVQFLETGQTTGSVNFPEIGLPYGGPSTHRILNVHHNKPGVLKAINNILSVYNVESQVLLTKGEVGYLVADVGTDASEEVKHQIAQLSTSIKTRVVY